jgi:hypothetical protein
LPLPIPIGCVSDAPAPLVEIVSVGADETTEVSVVGKFPTAAPLAFTPGLAAADGVLVVDETTEESSVANFAGALAAGDADGEGEAAAIGDGDSLDSAVDPFF